MNPTPARRPDLILIYKKKRACQFMDFPISIDYIVKIKKNDKEPGKESGELEIRGRIDTTWQKSAKIRKILRNLRRHTVNISVKNSLHIYKNLLILFHLIIKIDK